MMIANISRSEYKAADIVFPIIKISLKIILELKRVLVFLFCCHGPDWTGTDTLYVIWLSAWLQ